MIFRPIGEDWIFILSGTLDDPEVAPPGGHYGIESRISWPEYPTRNLRTVPDRVQVKHRPVPLFYRRFEHRTGSSI